MRISGANGDIGYGAPYLRLVFQLIRFLSSCTIKALASQGLPQRTFWMFVSTGFVQPWLQELPPNVAESHPSTRNR
jgi:hypothetical protein